MSKFKAAFSIAALLALSLVNGCSAVDGFGFTATSKNMPIPKGPPIQDVVTPFDEALACIRGKIDPSISFAVGQVIDATGKETYSEGGSGKMLSQGAGEMVQTALFRAGVTVVNRRDPNIPVVETQWGIRDIKQQTPVNFYISGSINSLDFIPGGGIEVDVAGIGARHRQNRILIALDLSLTDAFTGRIIANVPLQKQIFTSEDAVGTDRFFDTTLVSLSAGGMQREAAHFAMRQMLNFATLELIGQLISSSSYLPCKAMVAPVDGETSSEGSATVGIFDLAAVLSEAAARNSAAPLQALAAAAAPAPAPAAPVEITAEMRTEMERTTSLAGRSIVAAQASLRAESLGEAGDLVKEALQYLAIGIQSLKKSAAMGVSGPEGDAIAMLIEQAIKEVQAAQQAVQRREAEQPPATTGIAPAAPAAGQPAGAVPIEGSRDAVRSPTLPQ